MQVTGLTISPRHPYMFSCSLDKEVKCWDLEQNKVCGHKQYIEVDTSLWSGASCCDGYVKAEAHQMHGCVGEYMCVLWDHSLPFPQLLRTPGVLQAVSGVGSGLLSPTRMHLTCWGYESYCSTPLTALEPFLNPRSSATTMDTCLACTPSRSTQPWTS